MCVCVCVCVSLSVSLFIYIYIYIYGEKIDIFVRSDNIMKNKWKSKYTKNTDSGFSSEYFVLFIDRTFSTEK